MDVESLETRSGWRIRHRARTGSTNDDARDAALGPRSVVVADAQTAGRGREGRVFASPPGGLYASLLLDAPEQDVPAGVVALVALAAAEAIDAVVAGEATCIKWPNDLWRGPRKVGGILLERRGDGRVIAGIGINVGTVPEDLPPELRPHVGALGDGPDAPPTRDALLLALLAAVDRRQAERARDGSVARIETAWRARLALLGEPVTYTHAGRAHEGVLEDVSLERGLLLRDPVSGPVWRPGAHVQDLRPVGRRI